MKRVLLWDDFDLVEGVNVVRELLRKRDGGMGDWGCEMR